MGYRSPPPLCWRNRSLAQQHLLSVGSCSWGQGSGVRLQGLDPVMCGHRTALDAIKTRRDLKAVLTLAASPRAVPNPNPNPNPNP